jgi:hypothetical protein
MRLLQSFLFFVFSIVLSSQAVAASGIGGSGGGPRAEVKLADGTRVTVEICDNGDGPCKRVTYQIRPKGKPESIKCVVPWGDAGIDVPCPTNYGVPAWLAELSNLFKSDHKKMSGETAGNNTDFVGGP